MARVPDYADTGAYGSVLDNNVTTIKYSVQARFPSLAPVDALPLIGNDRSLIQGGKIAGPSESNTPFAERLRTFWESAAPFGGTPYAILQQLYYSLGYTDVAIVQQNGLIFTLDGAPTDDPATDLVITDAMVLPTTATPAPNRPQSKTIPSGSAWWRFDDKTDLCSRFAVIFSAAAIPASWTSIKNPPTATSAPTVSEINAIRQIIERWRNVESTCVGVYVQVPDPSGETAEHMWGYPTTQVWGQTGRIWDRRCVVQVFSP